MGIRVTCANGHTLNVKEHLAGKVGRCPECGGVVRIPAAAAPDRPQSAAPPPPAATPAPPASPPTPVGGGSAVAPPPLSPPTTPPPIPVIVAAERPLVTGVGRPHRDPRALARKRASQRRLALVLLSLLSLALAGVLTWVLLRQT